MSGRCFQQSSRRKLQCRLTGRGKNFICAQDLGQKKRKTLSHWSSSFGCDLETFISQLRDTTTSTNLAVCKIRKKTASSRIVGVWSMVKSGHKPLVDCLKPTKVLGKMHSFSVETFAFVCWLVSVTVFGALCFKILWVNCEQVLN